MAKGNRWGNEWKVRVFSKVCPAHSSLLALGEESHVLSEDLRVEVFLVRREKCLYKWKFIFCF